MVTMENFVGLIGRVTRDIEERKTNSDIPVCNFSIAVPRNGQPKDEEPDFFDCVAWRGTAQSICKFFHKGDPIGIIGFLKKSKYKDRDGNEREKVEIQVDSFKFMPTRKQRDDQNESVGEPVPMPVDPDNMPF